MNNIETLIAERFAEFQREESEGGYCSVPGDEHVFSGGYRAALRSQQAGSGEAVAWDILEKSGGSVLCTLHSRDSLQHYIDNGFQYRELYASPPLAREQLTDEEINALWLSFSAFGGNGNDFARAVIAADRAKREGK